MSYKGISFGKNISKLHQSFECAVCSFLTDKLTSGRSDAYTNKLQKHKKKLNLKRLVWFESGGSD